MANKKYNERNFRLLSDDKKIIVVNCWSENTSYGFRHLAVLSDINHETHTTIQTKAKCTYYNRTWESYTYQSVLKNVIDKHFGKDTESVERYKAKADELGDESHLFKSVAMINAFGSLLTDNQKDKNAWDKRMIEAGISGVSFPDNWDELPEEEKTARLQKVNELMKENK